MPITSLQQGRVSEEHAQIAAAMAADEAARLVLANATPATMSAILCQNFIAEMDALLSKEILGARVSRFQTAGLTPSHWP